MSSKNKDLVERTAQIGFQIMKVESTFSVFTLACQSRPFPTLACKVIFFKFLLQTV